MIALAFARAHWRLLLGGLGVMLLALYIGHLKGEVRHWQKQSDHFEALYHAEQSAHRLTVAGYRAEAEKARADDQANARRVETEQSKISQEVSHDYQNRLSALRARYDAIRVRSAGGATAADPGVGRNQDLPQAGDASSGFDDVSPVDPFACEANTLQLSELQAWVRAQSAIPIDSP